MYCVSVLFLIFPTICLVHTQQVTKSTDNYGPYNLKYEHFGTCKGPKANGLTSVTTSMDENAVSVINYTFFADTYVNEIKIQVQNIKGNKKNFLWNSNLRDPCKHYSVAFIIKEALNSENCFIKKGFYSSRVNFKNVTLTYFGSSFFYGTYFFKSMLLTKKGIVGCFMSTVVMTKKT